MFVSYCVSDDCEKYTLTNEGAGHYLNRVFVRTANRQFGLRRGSPTAPFYLELEALGGSTESLLNDRRAAIANCEFCVSGQMTWPSKVRSPAFQVKAVSQETVGERTFYRIEFHYGEAKGEDEGWLRVDPQSGWLLQDYSVKSQLTGSPRVLATSSGSITYRTADGLIAPSVITHHRTTEVLDRVTEQNEEVRVTNWVFAPTPREEFSLAFYGLGDFEKPGAHRGSPVAYWAAGLAVACFLISLVLAGIARKRVGRGRRPEQPP